MPEVIKSSFKSNKIYDGFSEKHSLFFVDVLKCVFWLSHPEKVTYLSASDTLWCRLTELCFGILPSYGGSYPITLYIYSKNVTVHIKIYHLLKRGKGRMTFFFGFGPKLVVFLLTKSSFFFLMFDSYNIRMPILSFHPWFYIDVSASPLLSYYSADTPWYFFFIFTKHFQTIFFK